MTYRIRFDADYDFDSGTKLPGWAIREGYGGGDGPKPDGTNGWSCKPKLGKSGQLAQYVYHMDMTREYGENFEIVPDFPLGEWVEVTQRLKLNSVASDGSANPDGLFEVWIDGTKERRETGLRFSTIPESQGMNVQMVFYYGGETPSPQDQGLNFDEFALSSGSLMPLPNRLVVRGTGTKTNYEFTTEGSVFSTGRNESSDTVSESTANAWITNSGSVDEWLFGERVSSFEHLEGGPVELELNGRSVDPSIDPTSWSGYDRTISPGEAPTDEEASTSSVEESTAQPTQ